MVPCFNLVLPSVDPPLTLRALESCRHAGEGLPCCPVTSSGSSSAANGRAGEEYQVRALYHVRADPLLLTFSTVPPQVRMHILGCGCPLKRMQDVVDAMRVLSQPQAGEGGRCALYKIFVCFTAFVHKRIVPFLPLFIGIAHTIAIILPTPLRNVRPPPPPLCMPYTIQNWYGQYPVKAKAGTQFTVVTYPHRVCSVR